MSVYIKAVGVFVNEDIGIIQKLCRKNVIDIIQIHGDEDADYLLALKRAVATPMIRAVRVQNESDVKNTITLPADYTLFDTYQKGSYGGTGKPFDWRLLAEYPKPFFLAGGLCLENLESAVNACRPWCVDVSSGAEADGKKDRQKMQRIIELAGSVK